MTSIDLQGHLRYFSLKINVTYFLGVIESQCNLTKDEIADDLE